MVIKFYHDDEDTKRMAIFVAQLVREGVSFVVENCQGRTEITLMGGH